MSGRQPTACPVDAVAVIRKSVRIRYLPVPLATRRAVTPTIMSNESVMYNLAPHCRSCRSRFLLFVMQRGLRRRRLVGRVGVDDRLPLAAHSTEDGHSMPRVLLADAVR